MKPLNVPDDALALVPSPIWPSYVPNMLSYFMTYASLTTAGLTDKFTRECADWTSNNLQRRGNGQSLTEKPVPPTPAVFMDATDSETGTVWAWIAPGTQLAGCPDLPSLPPTPPADNIRIGVRLGTSGTSVWFSMKVDDTCPQGFKTPTPGTSEDGVVGIFQKVLSTLAGPSNPFLGWWELIG